MNDQNNKALKAFLIDYSDSDFTNPHEVVLPDEPKDCTGDFTHMGAKYWGAESRRHKATSVLAGESALSYEHDAHNWIHIGLKKRAIVDMIRISTKWYTGNQVRAVSVILKDEMTGDKIKVLDRVELKPDAEHEFDVPATLATECFVECYYEGGISRINLFGKPAEDQLPKRENLLEKATISHISNDHYGNPDMAVKGVRNEMHMVGWESARTGFGERALFHLAEPAEIGELVVDTYLHRLNSPLTCHFFAGSFLEGENIDEMMNKAPRWKLVFEDDNEIVPDDFQDYMLEQKYLEEKVSNNKSFKIKLDFDEAGPWQPLLPFAPLKPDAYHRFTELDASKETTHILYMHYPNGGIHGLKVFGI
jgi:allantoicase